MFYCDTPNLDLGLHHSFTVLTDLQILGCELHTNAFGVAGGAIALSRSLAVIRERRQREEKGKDSESMERRKRREGNDVKG